MTVIFIPPVVTVLGHVDHGKTTLLDTIRKTNVAQREVGGITQRIGAYQIEASHDGGKRPITFIDTPGHEAFLNMRKYGVTAADIAILVVAANEGVKPQTKESIRHIKESDIPYIVALTKSDLPDINIEKIKQELTQAGVLLEGLGGNTPYISVSAKKGTGIKELLDLILLIWDMEDKKEKDGPTQAVVIESRLDAGRGPTATVVVKSGKLATQEELFVGGRPFKIRAIFNSQGVGIKQAPAGWAVEILGFTEVPAPGEIVQITSEEAKEEQPKQLATDITTLSVILKADTQGTLEAIVGLLPKEILIIEKGSGEVTEGDILLAKAHKSIVIALNAKAKPDVIKLAQIEKVIVKEYKIIYEMVEEIKEVVRELKNGVAQESILGKGKILAEFPYDKTKVLGIKVIEGRIAVGDRIKLVRADIEIGKSTIKSMRKVKEEIKVAQRGTECGMVIDPVLDFELGDMVLSYRI